MGLYNYSDGVLTPIAGRGKAVYGASDIRKKTITTSIPGNSYVSINVTFDDPLDSADYLVEVTGTSVAYLSYLIYDKTVNGFKVYWSNYWHASENVTATYTAYKLYTDNEYNGLLNNQRYSTDEIDTGKTWIDGKPIYRKVFSLTTPSNGTETAVVASFADDVETVTFLDGKMNVIDSANKTCWWPINFRTTTDVAWTYAQLNPSTNKWDIRQCMQYTRCYSRPEYIILEYTKTT